MNHTLSEKTIRREAEYVRWVITGREGTPDVSHWWTEYDYANDWLHLCSEADKVSVSIPGIELRASLDEISDRYIRPFVSKLPSVLASARVKGDLEYESWGRQ